MSDNKSASSLSSATSANEETDTAASSSMDASASGSSQQTSSSVPSSEAEGSAQGTIDRLEQFMQRLCNLGFKAPEQEEGEEEAVPKVLEEVTLEGVAQYIRSNKCKNIVTMVGAGISTSAGIPDFRSPGTGLYDNLQQYNLPDPQAIFSIDFFRENPKPFFVLAKELFPGTLKPTVGHYFIRMLHDKGLLLRHYTQNIDTLERVAGLPADKLVEAHGSFHTAHCQECGAAYTLPWIKEKIFADEIPTCTDEDCDGVVKPDIVFFGESLPARFVTHSSKDMKECDLLIVMGTSLVVQPFASLVNRVPTSTPRLYINLEKPPSGQDDFLALLLGGGGSFRFDAENNYRDVFLQETCDDGCTRLADLLKWGRELSKLVKEEHAKIDKEMAAEGKTTHKAGEAGGASSL